MHVVDHIDRSVAPAALTWRGAAPLCLFVRKSSGGIRTCVQQGCR